MVKKSNSKSPQGKKKPANRKPRGRQLLKNGLTIKQERFCQEYINTGNATESYRRVYSTKNMKEATINRSAKALVDHPKVSARLIQLKERLQRTYDISRERLLYELEGILNARITDYLEFDGTIVRFKSFEKLTDQQIAAIDAIKQNEKGEVELKIHGKSWTTERICKILGYDAPKKLNIEGSGLGILYLPERNEK